MKDAVAVSVSKDHMVGTYLTLTITGKKQHVLTTTECPYCRECMVEVLGCRVAILRTEIVDGIGGADLVPPGHRVFRCDPCQAHFTQGAKGVQYAQEG